MNISKILESGLELFSVHDLKQILQTNDENTIRTYLYRARKQGLVENVYYGIWKLVARDVNIFQLATKIKKKSYISFESVLKEKGVIFQYYGKTIFLASDNSGEKKYNDWMIKFFKLKNDILLNPIGVENTGKYQVACLERAICDTIYRSPGYYFDDLSSVDFDILQDLSKIYNKRVVLEVKKILKDA